MTSALCPVSISSYLDMQIIGALHVKLDQLRTFPKDMLNTMMMRNASLYAKLSHRLNGV